MERHSQGSTVILRQKAPGSGLSSVRDVTIYMYHFTDIKKVLPVNDKPWWQKQHLRRLNILLGFSMLLTGSTGVDLSLMNGLQSLPQWQEFMKYPKGAYLGGITAIQVAGACFGFAIMSIVSNHWGRKSSIYLGYVAMVIGVPLQTASQNPGMFIASRAIIGLGCGLCGSAPALITECAYPTHRGKLTAAWNCFYFAGAIFSAWVTYGTRNYPSSWAWRIPSVTQICLPLVAFLPICMMPESPRWEASKGRFASARKFFIDYHADGDETSPLVKFEMAEIEQALKVSRTKSVSYLDMLRTPGNRRRTFLTVSLALHCQWNGSGVVGFYLSIVLNTVGITSATNQTLINGFLQLWNFLIALTAASLVDRAGRRPLFILSGVGMLLSFSTITGLSAEFAHTNSSSVGIAVVPMLFLFYAFFCIAYTPLAMAYPAEIWQFELRSRGIALASIVGFAALAVNLFVNPIGFQELQWKYYLVYVGLLVVICIVTYLYYVETKGHSLEEIAMIFDGEDVDFEHMAQESLSLEVRLDKKRLEDEKQIG